MARLSLIALALVACEATPKGEVLLTLDWPDRPAATVWLSARVEERAPDTEARTLAETGRLAVEAGAPADLVLPKVQNGAHRVVVIEGRDADDGDLLPRYGGVSAPFSVRAGATTRVAVPIVLRPVDRPEADARVRLCFGQICDPARVRPAELAAARVITETRGIVSVQLANEPSFASGSARRVRISDEVCVTEGEGTRCDIPWDLTADVESLEGGVHAVFVRFEDAEGFELPLRPASVVRDGAAPLLLGATATAAAVRPGEAISVVLDVSEPLDIEASALRVTGGATASALVRLGDALGYRARLDVDPAARGSLAFSARLVDALGNAANDVVLVDAGGGPLEIAVDAVAPTFELLEVSAPRLGAADADATWWARFAVAEAAPPLAGLPTLTIGGVEAEVTRAAEADRPDADPPVFGFRAERHAMGESFADQQGPQRLEARWVDRAGNQARGALGTVEVDFRPPSALDCALLPALAAAGQPVTYQIFASEPLASARLSDPPEGFAAMGALDEAGRVATWTAVDGPEDLPLVAELEDMAGHRVGGVCPLRGRRDLAPIDLSDRVTWAVHFEDDGASLETTPYARGGAVVTLQVDLDGEAPRSVGATLGGRLMQRTEAGFALALPDVHPEGPAPIVLTVEDAAGNRSEWGASVIVDRTRPTALTRRLEWPERPPFLLPVNNERPYAPAGAEVHAVLRFAEPVTVALEVGDRAPIPGGEPGSGDVLRVPIPAPEIEGIEAVRLVMTDRAGNTVISDLGEIDWDFTAPAAVSPEATVLVRSPWGSDETGGVPRSWVEVLERRPWGTTWEVVRGDLQGRCEPEVVLLRGDEAALAAGVVGDLPRACVRQYDRAGNASPLAPIRSGEWVATLGGEDPGDDLANPHQLVATPWLDLWRLADRGEGIGPEVARLDGELAESRGAWAWWRVGDDASPGAGDHLTFDPHRGRLMTLAAREDGALTPWAFRLAERGWFPAPPSPQAPSARTRAVVLFDSLRDRLLLFGGLDGEALSDAWAWSASGGWTRMARDLCGFGIEAAFDPLRDRVVMVGGICGERRLAPSLWNPVVETAAATPPERALQGRMDHAVAWDPADGVVLSYGGVEAFEIGRPLADLWAWDGARWTRWEDGAVSGPGPRAGHRMAWDDTEGRRRLVLYAMEDGQACGRVWERSPGPRGRWTSQRLAPPCPGAADAMVWVEAWKRVVLRSGETLWQWDGEDGRWRKVAPVFEQRPAPGAWQLVSDGLADRLYLGERDRVHILEPGDAAWHISPEPLPAEGALGWSPIHGLLLSGQDAVWGGGPEAWAPLEVAGAPPEDPQAFFVGYIGQAVMRVANAGGRLGIWQLGQTWAALDLSGGGPPGPGGTAGAWLGERLVFFGGGDFGDAPFTWTWHPEEGWEARPAEEGEPGARQLARMTYGQPRRRVLMFGGYLDVPVLGGETPPFFDDLWEWDGDRWTAPARTTPWPEARRAPAFAYDQLRRRAILFGGSGPRGALNDLWEGGMAAGRPALRFDVRIGAANLPRDATLLELRVRGHVGGRGGEGFAGARMQAWQNDDWIEVASNEATPEEPALIEWATGQQRELRVGFTGPRRTASFTITPRGINGTGAAVVTADYLEARLRYQLAD